MVDSNIIFKCIGALTGSFSDMGELSKEMISCPFLIQNKFFWDNFKYFLKRIHLTEEEKEILRNKLTVDGNYNDNAKRIIYVLSDIDTEKKVDYVIYATKSLMDGKIEIDEYFRVCNAITTLIYEDLQFLKANIDNNNLRYGLAVQALMNAGIISRNQSPMELEYSYSFTPFAEKIYKNAICPEDHHDLRIGEPKPRDAVEIASNEDIDNMFK